ncbi:MAG: hypothetical protein QNJ53_14700 [Pleurocapsa sp. MO_192.B19]|nr:hypothetical protein [Pleurocapsa sp. MO_192.B19]
MSEVDRFFDAEIKAIAASCQAIASSLAEQLQEDVLRQIRRNFSNPTTAFAKGVKIYHFETASYVRLNPLLSSFAQDTTIEGNPNLWILLPDGAKLGFKRIGKGFNWSDIKRRYGNRLRFVKVADGSVLLYRTPQGDVKAIYKLQRGVDRKQKIQFFESAERIAQENNLEVIGND